MISSEGFEQIESRDQGTIGRYWSGIERGVDMPDSEWHPDYLTDREGRRKIDHLMSQQNSRLSSMYDVMQQDALLFVPQDDDQVVIESYDDVFRGRQNTQNQYAQHQAQQPRQYHHPNVASNHSVMPTMTPGLPGWNQNVKPGLWEGQNVNQGPVFQMYFSTENIRQIGDYFERAGLGRPDKTNLWDDMIRVLQQEPDFMDFGPIRTQDDVIMQVMRLNSRFLTDIIPRVKLEKWAWMRYQQDQLYGYSDQLINRPVSSDGAKQHLEFNNRF